MPQSALRFPCSWMCLTWLRCPHICKAGRRPHEMGLATSGTWSFHGGGPKKFWKLHAGKRNKTHTNTQWLRHCVFVCLWATLDWIPTTPLATLVVFPFFFRDFIHLCLALMSTSGKQMPSDIAELKDHWTIQRGLCKGTIAIPVSTATCERSISTLKLVKTYLKSTMDDVRLSNLGVLSVESRRAKALDFGDFVNRFATNHNNRRIRLL